ncbi:hypothetical protein D3C85_1656720 [compost metagenome]
MRSSPLLSENGLMYAAWIPGNSLELPLVSTSQLRLRSMVTGGEKRRLLFHITSRPLLGTGNGTPW